MSDPRRGMGEETFDFDLAGSAPESPGHRHHDGHRDRLRARFLEAGSDALADYEMLEPVGRL